MLVEIEQECDPDIEIAAIIKEHEQDGRPVFFPHVAGGSIPIVSGLFGFRAAFDLTTRNESAYSVGEFTRADSIKPGRATDPASFINRLYQAIQNRSDPALFDESETAPCQEIVESPDYLNEMPILKHLPGDGGKYITSGVAIYSCPTYGRNISYHRMMVIGADRLAARVVETRGLDTALKESGGMLEAAIVIGNSTQVAVAGSTSPPKGVDELTIANTLSPLALVPCKTIDVQVPTDSEFVIEGRFIPELVDEGPFLDLTGTLDIIRQQHVFEVTCITHRTNPIYHALLPGGMEHQLLMGLPREATMLSELLPLGYVTDVRLSEGSSHWFNAIVQVEQGSPLVPEDVYQACFKGHGSLKNCIIVDDDVNIDDPKDVEWAITTRSQFDRNLVMFPGEHGSSLDPSSNQHTRETCKVGLDATIPRDRDAKKFLRSKYGEG